MKNANLGDRARLTTLIALAIGAQFLFFTASASTAQAQQREADISFDGLKLVENSKVAKAYIDPEADFSVYKRVKILAPYVAFRSHWKRDQNRERPHRLKSSDIERIKRDVAALFDKVFKEELEAHDGYQVVEVIGDDVLLLRPAIIDVDISTPDTLDSERGHTYSTSTGAATLYIELFDSVSGQIIGRASDRQNIRKSAGSIAWTNRATNTADGRRLFRSWAGLLRNFLDQHYKQ
jgi:hypothetical protein